MDVSTNEGKVRLPVIGKGGVVSKIADVDVEAELKKFEEEQMAALGLH